MRADRGTVLLDLRLGLLNFAHSLSQIEVEFKEKDLSKKNEKKKKKKKSKE